MIDKKPDVTAQETPEIKNTDVSPQEEPRFYVINSQVLDTFLHRYLRRLDVNSYEEAFKYLNENLQLAVVSQVSKEG